MRTCSATGAMKDQCGLPFACVVEPFAKMATPSISKDSVVLAQDVGRCSECYA